MHCWIGFSETDDDNNNDDDDDDDDDDDKKKYKPQCKNKMGLMFSSGNRCSWVTCVSCLCVDIFRKAALLFGWAVFLLLAYKVSKLDRENQEYNPYEVLNLDPVKTHKTYRLPYSHKFDSIISIA